MPTFVCRVIDGKQMLVDKATDEPIAPSATIGLARPSVISDHLPDVQSMASGKLYDSKRALRAEYARLGVMEIGTERVEPKPFRPDSKANETALVTALEKVKQGYRNA